ncbi:amino acid transporter [Sporocytophaga myxococcoides]|uniref:Amino acid transporter n=1 Tax=Sporocytophaga myxococcoides TaxID=153721 RepID=A0A098LHT3_9BACT|nr:APC family permease [Sporocytophaga myxococcoides]GAL85982.1 amino acid transporter [Sporocytophaga myxococcoides]
MFLPEFKTFEVEQEKISFLKKLKQLLIGSARNTSDSSFFQHTTLISFLAWVGLGADSLSSSSYGPPEAFIILNQHHHLGLIVALMSSITIFIVCSGYNLIIDLFPKGGGGYFVAGKLLSPKLGMVSGCALILDYVLTITISIASGTDAIFSLFPGKYSEIKLPFSFAMIFFFILINLRGIKESIKLLLPIFLLFLTTHVIAITYSLISHFGNLGDILDEVLIDFKSSKSQLGTYGLIFLILKAFTMGAGTFTGIEAVSNGMPVLREPKASTAKKTMAYMAFSLAFMVLGLMISYLLFHIEPEQNKTLNAVLYGEITKDWTLFGPSFVIVILLSESCLLFVAAQTGFLDGPRVLANMATDKWFPTSFAMLSDRFVIQKGIILMGILSGLIMAISHQSVKFLVILYSINVFITFTLSQLGMSKHWWKQRKIGDKWLKKFFINGSSFIVCGFILIMVIILKFHEGGWITLLITFIFILLALTIRNHYDRIERKLRKLDAIVPIAELEIKKIFKNIKSPNYSFEYIPKSSNKTAVLFVNGFNGLGISSLLYLLKLFDAHFKNIVFVEIGILNTRTLLNEQVVHNLDEEVKSDLKHYVHLVNKFGFEGGAIRTLGTDVTVEAEKIASTILEKYSNCIFFGGQILFSDNKTFSKYLHNYAAFSLQRRFYEKGLPFIILPIDIT